MKRLHPNEFAEVDGSQPPQVTLNTTTPPTVLPVAPKVEKMELKADVGILNYRYNCSSH